MTSEEKREFAELYPELEPLVSGPAKRSAEHHPSPAPLPPERGSKGPSRDGGGRSL
jgi:hypothetical protein